MQSGQTVAEVLKIATDCLQGAEFDCGSPRLDAELILGHVTNWTRTEIHRRIMDPIREKDCHQFWRLLKEREKGVPVAYLVGWKEFYSRRFSVRPDVLVPRPETEHLVEKSLSVLSRSPGPTKVLDLCCGTGCIGITICLETLTSRVVLSDISPQAIEQTEENVANFGIGERTIVVRSDLFSELEGERFDLIVSNPPYVGTDFGPRPDPEVAAHEPSLALFSGRDGTDHIKAIVERAPAYLMEGGSLVLECASFQAEKIEAWMATKGFNQTALWHDLRGLPRGVSGRWEG